MTNALADANHHQKVTTSLDRENQFFLGRRKG